MRQLERQGADIQTKVEELEELNQSLRNRDKIKDNAISQLSDQLVVLTTTRIQEIEKDIRYSIMLRNDENKYALTKL
jgi:hypothetical protein